MAARMSAGRGAHPVGRYFPGGFANNHAVEDVEQSIVDAIAGYLLVPSAERLRRVS
jgi:hypothetical protein